MAKDRGIQHSERRYTKPEQWAGRVGVEGSGGSGPVQLQRMRGRGWSAQRVQAERGKSAPGGDLRPEYPK